MTLSSFSAKIITWYQINKRTLPWRDTTDPYKIWVSEIILQQGWTVAVLDLGAEGKEGSNTQSLVKIRKSKQSGTLSGEDDGQHSEGP